MARTDTLGNFLTDVADAIRTKAGTSELIQASTFDTAIANIPSGGSINPQQVGDINDMIVDAIDKFNDYMLDYPSTYDSDTTEATTLHTPDANCPYYGIQKRSNGKYRAFWTIHPILAITTSIFRPSWGYSVSYDALNTSIKSLTLQIIPGISSANESTPQYYYSSEYNTINDCIQGLKNNTLTYTSYTGAGLGYVADSPLVIPYSNATYIDCRTSNEQLLLPSKRISSNETIST